LNVSLTKESGAGLALALAILIALIFFFTRPVAEVAIVQRDTAIAAVYGTVRIEPTVSIPLRAQNAGYIRLASAVADGRGAIGKSVAKDELLATIADETTARQLKQARMDLEAAQQRAQLPLPSQEPLKVAEDNAARLEKLSALSNIPAVEYEKAKSEVTRLRGLLESERIERDRNLQSLDDACRKLEAQMKNSEIRAPIDGLLTAIQAIDGTLVSEGNALFTVASRKNYVRGEVNEEDVGEVKPGMPAIVHVYAFRTRRFSAKVSAVQPAADPDTQRYAVVLELENAPDNLLAGMSGEMNIITGRHENALLVPTRALIADQALVVSHGMVQSRTINVGYRTLEYSEALSGIAEGEHVVVSGQDRLRPGRFARQRVVALPAPAVQ
jgi:RND family efflux transporter MFP subunit